MRLAVLVLSLAFLPACRTANRQVSVPGEGLVLCVENATIGYGNLTVRVDPIRFDVLPSQTVCRELGNIGGAVTISAVTTAGGAAGPLSYTASIPSSAPGCWHWRLGNSQSTQIALARCRD